MCRTRPGFVRVRCPVPGAAWALIPHPHVLVPPSALVEGLRARHEALRIMLANDKIDHVVGFALLMGWFCRLYESGSGRARVTVALLARAARVVHGLATLPPLPDTVGVRALADEKVARRLLAAVPLTNGSGPPLAHTSARGSTNRWTARYARPGAADLLARGPERVTAQGSTLCRIRARRNVTPGAGRSRGTSPCSQGRAWPVIGPIFASASSDTATHKFYHVRADPHRRLLCRSSSPWHERWLRFVARAGRADSVPGMYANAWVARYQPDCCGRR